MQRYHATVVASSEESNLGSVAGSNGIGGGLVVAQGRVARGTATFGFTTVSIRCHSSICEVCVGRVITFTDSVRSPAPRAGYVQGIERCQRGTTATAVSGTSSSVGSSGWRTVISNAAGRRSASAIAVHTAGSWQTI
jgi:hypothetical protein